MTLSPETRRNFIAETFFTCMLLFENAPEQATIERWTDEEIKTAMDWAHAEYLRRQIDSMMPDNNPKPSILQQFA